MSDELAAQTALEEVAKATEESATLLLEDPPKELEPPSKQSKLCQLCRRALPENAPGRLKQKTFSCRSCLSLQTTLYRHVGPAPLSDFSVDDKAKFYAKCNEAPVSERYQWKTLRSVLITRMISKRICEQEQKVTSKALPLSVWVKQGWEETAVLACPSEEDPVLGLLYTVPVKVDTIREVHQKIEERISELERAMAEKKTDKKRKAQEEQEPEQELEVGSEPTVVVQGGRKGVAKKKAARGAESQETGSAKTQRALATEKAKTDKANQSSADLAARALSSCTSFLKSFSAVLRQLESLKLPKDSVLTDAVAELNSWRKAATELLSLHEASKGTGVPLASLPFNALELKERQKLWSELLAGARQSVKAKKQQDKETKDSEKPAAKRQDKKKTPKGN